MPFIRVGELFGSYVFLIDQGAFWLYLAAVVALLAVGVPWLANLDQPKPVWPVGRLPRR